MSALTLRKLIRDNPGFLDGGSMAGGDAIEAAFAMVEKHTKYREEPNFVNGELALDDLNVADFQALAMAIATGSSGDDGDPLAAAGAATSA